MTIILIMTVCLCSKYVHGHQSISISALYTLVHISYNCQRLRKTFNPITYWLSYMICVPYLSENYKRKNRKEKFSLTRGRVSWVEILKIKYTLQPHSYHNACSTTHLIIYVCTYIHISWRCRVYKLSQYVRFFIKITTESHTNIQTYTWSKNKY